MVRWCAVLVSALALTWSLLPMPMTAGASAQSQVTVGLGAEPLTLLPATADDWTTEAQLQSIYDPLFTRDPKTEKVIPWLATGYKIIDDRTWELTLRRGVRFQDGEPFTAKAVKFLFDYVLDPKNKSQYLPRFQSIERVDVINEFAVRIYTSKPFPVLLTFLADPGMFVMAPDYVEKSGFDYASSHPIGTGPYRFKQWDRGQQLVLTRNPTYWAGVPKLDTVVFRVIPDFSARLAALLSGEIDVMKDVPPQAVDTVNRSGRAAVRPVVSAFLNFLALETLHPGPMQNVQVRQAMNYAINVDEIIKSVLAGRATRVCGYASQFDPAYDSSLKCYPYDPGKAAQLLQAAGYDPHTLVLTLDTPSGRYPLDKDVSEAIAAQLSKIGIKATVRVNEWRDYLDKIVNRRVGDMFYLGWGSDFDPTFTMGNLFAHSETYGSFANPQIEQRITTAEGIVQPSAYAAAFRGVNNALQPLAPWVPLWQQHDLYGVANWLNWQPRTDQQLSMWQASAK